MDDAGDQFHAFTFLLEACESALPFSCTSWVPTAVVLIAVEIYILLSPSPSRGGPPFPES